MAWHTDDHNPKFRSLIHALHVHLTEIIEVRCWDRSRKIQVLYLQSGKGKNFKFKCGMWEVARCSSIRVSLYKKGYKSP